MHISNKNFNPSTTKESKLYFRARKVNEAEEEVEDDNAKWDVRFNIGDAWKEVDDLDTDIPEELDQFKAFIMPKIRRFRDKMQKFLEDDEAIIDLEKIIDELDDSLDAIEWDLAWSDFYEWAEKYNVQIEAEENFMNDNEEENIENQDEDIII